MGHYDTCRNGYCGVCGQVNGYCSHTTKYKKEEIYPYDMDEDCMIWIVEQGACVVCGELTNAYCFDSPICSYECREIFETRGK